MVGLDGWSCRENLNPQKFKIDSCEMEKRRPLRRQPNDHNFGSLIMLAVTAGAFLLVTRIATTGLFLVLQESAIR
jgi:hypothetical protein